VAAIATVIIAISATMIASPTVITTSVMASTAMVIAVVVIGAGCRAEGQHADRGKNSQLAGFEGRHL
jgi:hypothetical protein